MHRKRKGNLLANLLSPKWCALCYTQLSKNLFSLMASKSDHIKQFGHHCSLFGYPTICAHVFASFFGLLSQTKLGALATLTRLCEQVPVNSLLDPLTRVEELRNYFMARSQRSQAEPSKAFSLQLYHLWCILIIMFGLSDRGCLLNIRALDFLETRTFTKTSTDKLYLMWISHIAADTQNCLKRSVMAPVRVQ